MNLQIKRDIPYAQTRTVQFNQLVAYLLSIWSSSSAFNLYIWKIKVDIRGYLYQTHVRNRLHRKSKSSYVWSAERPRNDLYGQSLRNNRCRLDYKTQNTQLH